jgi:low temperature requirement protein LtrA
VYVFAVTQLSHLLLAHLDWAGAAETLVLLTAVWWGWNFTAWFTNWFDPDQLAVRLTIVGIMLAGLVMSAALPEAFGGRGLVFVLAYLAMQLGRHLFAAVALRGAQLSREYVRAMVWFGLSAVFWLAGALLHGAAARAGLWAVAALVEYLAAGIGFPVPGLGRSSTTAWNISGEHFVERCRLFVIIALGESILVSGQTFGGARFDAGRTAAFVTAFATAVTMWWIYFALAGRAVDSVVETTADTGRMGLRITYVHLPIVAGVIVTAVGDEIVISHSGAHAAGFTTAFVLAAGPALFLAGHLLLKRIMFGYFNRARHVGLVALALLVPVGTVLPPLAVFMVSAAVLVAVAGADVVAVRRITEAEAVSVEL